MDILEHRFVSSIHIAWKTKLMEVIILRKSFCTNKFLKGGWQVN